MGKGKKKKRSGKKKTSSGPTTGATAYRGRLTIPRAFAVNSEPTMVWLRAFNTITSTAGGVISPVYSNTDPRTLAIDFSNYAALYTEYRVLGIHVEYQPGVMFSTNNVLTYGQPWGIGTIRGSLSSATTYTDVATLPDVKLKSVNQPWRWECRSVQPLEMGFISVSTDPTSSYSIRTFASGYAATTTYGSTIVTYCLQFLARF